MKFSISLFLVALIAGCSSQNIKPPIDSSLNVSKLPLQESWMDTVAFSDSGKTKALLIAGHLTMFDHPNETLLDSNVKVNFYDENQIQTTTLTSLKGRVDNTNNNLYAIDSVVAINDSGVVLRTQELMWNNNTRKIITDKFVTITTPKEKIQGYGFESDQSLRNYTIYNITYATRNDTLKNKK